MEHPSTFHALLIGIDAYSAAPLNGCVNDIDAVERALRARLPPATLQIQRLSAPRPGTRADRAADPLATLANLRTALRALGKATVAPNDRVLIYYSGHGLRLGLTVSNKMTLFREAIVPTDYDVVPNDLQLLYDFEVNELIEAIVARTSSVALILDCCHSSGVIRSGLGEDQLDRCLTLETWTRPAPPELERHIERRRRVLCHVEDCLVVAACREHERAREERGRDGVHQGLLTRAFLGAIDANPGIELPALTWNAIWPEICDRVDERNPNQHPRMFGDAGRTLAGPPVRRDPGIPVRWNNGSYWIGAGTLASVTTGAQLALYDSEPAYFDAIDTKEDREARIGMLEVIRAERAWATAVAAKPTRPINLPSDARARLVATGAPARLRYAVVPPDRRIEAALASSPLLEPALEGVKPHVRLECSQRRWFLTDAIHGLGHDGPVLCSFGLDQIDRARSVLEHYHAYWQPLRIATEAKDLPGALALSLHRCPTNRDIRGAEAERAAFPEITTPAEGNYRVSSRALIFFKVTNSSSYRLRVTLVNSAASGRVQMIGDQTIEPDSFKPFWCNGTMGAPFLMLPPNGADRCVDRLVAIGRTDMSASVDFLQLDTRFADLLRRNRSTFVNSHRATPATGHPPPEYWTAAQVVIESWVDESSFQAL